MKMIIGNAKIDLFLEEKPLNDVKWIKISTDIFDNWKIKQIKSMPEGYKMICVWFQLLCLCGKCNESGLIILSGKVVANDELLSNIFGEDLKIIQLSIRTFEALGMIEVTTDGVTRVSNWDEYQNADALEKIREYERTRKAKQREKRKMLESKNKDKIPEPRSCYSSSKSNVENLNYVLGYYKDEYGDILKSENLLESIREWMDYKDHKKPARQNHYDTERGMKKFLTQILNNISGYGEEAVISVINESMANNYQGIIWDRLNKRRKSNGCKAGEKDKPHEGYIQKFIDAGTELGEFEGF